MVFRLWKFVKSKIDEGKTGYGLTVSFLFGLIISLLYFFGAFTKLEYVSSDILRAKFTKKIESSDIVYLLITDATLIEADEVDGIQWPWPRSAYGEAVRFLRNAGARAIGFDVIFSETSAHGPEDDLGLAESFKEGSIFLATMSTANKGNTSHKKIEENRKKMDGFNLKTSIARFNGTLKDYPYFRPPVDTFLPAVEGLGDIKFLSDLDGVGRKYGLLVRSGEKLYPSLGLALAIKALDIEEVTLSRKSLVLEGDGVKREIPLDSSGKTTLKYYGDSSVYEKYLLLRVIKSQILMDEGGAPYYDPAFFKDKVVLIGSDATDLKDLRPNPFNKKNDAGVHYHGTVVDNILRGEFLTSYYENLFVIPVILIFSIGVAFGAANLGALAGFIISAISASGYILLSIWLFTSHNILIELPATIITLIGCFSLVSIVNYLLESKQKTFITGAFGQYLSPKVVAELVKNPGKLKLGGERREMTAFFSDVAGFSSISESLEPEELVSLLNDYLSEMCAIIGKYEGTVDKFEGDAIIAFWGAPIETDRHAFLACKASVEMQERLKELREKWKNEGKHQLFVRIGLNTGPMVVGNMGSRSRMDYTMMGDSVNLASRLEGANKFYGTYMMISEFTHSQINEEFEVRELDLLRVVGKNEPVRVYELLGEKGKVPENITYGAGLFQKALELYRKREFLAAKDIFQKVKEHIPEDPPSREYVYRCEQMSDNMPDADWDGVFTLTSKG